MKAVPDVTTHGRRVTTNGSCEADFTAVAGKSTRIAYKRTRLSPYQNRLWWIGKVYQDLAQIARKELGKLIMDSRPVILDPKATQSQTSDPGDCLLKT